MELAAVHQGRQGSSHYAARVAPVDSARRLHRGVCPHRTPDRLDASALRPSFPWVDCAAGSSAFSGGLEATLGAQRSEVAALSLPGKSEELNARDSYRVWMTEFHRFGGGGGAPRALVQADQPYRRTTVLLREAIADFLADSTLPLPAECERILTRTPPKVRRPSQRSRSRATSVLPSGSTHLTFRAS